MPSSTQGLVAKLSRAYTQLTVLQGQVSSRFPSAKLWPLTMKEHRPGLEYRFHLGDIPSVDMNWALATSEILFNARSALDYLAYELHVRHFRGSIPPKVAGTSMFPIFDNQADFASSGARRIKRLAQKDRGAIQHLQPYITRNDCWKYTRSSLSLLNSLQNSDKHRRLHLVAAAQAAAFSHQYPEWCGFDLDIATGSLESGDWVQTWSFRRPPPEMKSNDGTILAIALEHDGQMMSLLGSLSEITNHVSLVVERFADRFTKVPRPPAWRPEWWAPPVPKGTSQPPSRSLFVA